VYKYNLVLCHVPRGQGISDFMTIRHMLAGRAPEIRVQIVSSGPEPAPDKFWQAAAARPTLIFSPVAIPELGPGIRGTRLISQSVTKLEERELIVSTGARVPDTRLVTKDLRLDAAQWGPFTVIKPNRGLRGQGIGLIRTRDVGWTDTTLLPKKDPRHRQELLAQRFIDTGPDMTCYRVFTVLGRAIYCMKSATIDAQAPLDASGSEALDVAVAVNNMVRKLELANDREIIDLSTSIHAKLPHLPVMGIDIIREQPSGRLFVLEYNSTGRIWHLSSDHGIAHQQDHGVDYYGQFDALSTIANALIDVTRQRAA
jgi:hypothetical protein